MTTLVTPLTGIIAPVLFILMIHSFADSILQSSKLRYHKMLHIIPLLEHVGIYTLFFIVLSPFVLGLTFVEGLQYSLINGGLHLVIDFVSGRLKNKYLDVDDAKYLSVVGFDHTLHIIILIYTYVALFPDAYLKLGY